MDDSEVQLDGDFDRMPRSGSGSSISAIKVSLVQRVPSRAGHEQFHFQSHDVKAAGGRTAAESADRFESLLQELIVTERSYVRRVETLYKVGSRTGRNSAQRKRTLTNLTALLISVMLYPCDS